MNRRSFVAALGSVPLALLAVACADSDGPADTVPTTAPASTVAPTTLPSVSGIEHPMGADEVVLRLSWEGGFVPSEMLFMRLPRVLVAGDGSVYFQGAVLAIYPGPLLPPVLVGRITEAEIQELLVAARDANLFRAVTYQQPDNGVADAPNTLLVINANGETYTHDAYALGIGGTETDPDRIVFQKFVELLEPLALGLPDSSSFAAERFAIRATTADNAPPTDGITPNEVAWPTGAGVSLAAASDCAVVEASAIGSIFNEATQITRFVDGGIKYVLLVRPLLPGDAGC